jgi:hypothetical protein
MAIDTAGKRASTVGLYWPVNNVDRAASVEEYSFYVTGGDIPGVPELRTLTMHRTDTQYTIRRTPGGYTTRRR